MVTRLCHCLGLSNDEWASLGSRRPLTGLSAAAALFLALVAQNWPNILEDFLLRRPSIAYPPLPPPSRTKRPCGWISVRMACVGGLFLSSSRTMTCILPLDAAAMGFARAALLVNVDAIVGVVVGRGETGDDGGVHERYRTVATRPHARFPPFIADDKVRSLHIAS